MPEVIAAFTMSDMEELRYANFGRKKGSKDKKKRKKRKWVRNALIGAGVVGAGAALHRYGGAGIKGGNKRLAAVDRAAKRSSRSVSGEMRRNVWMEGAGKKAAERARRDVRNIGRKANVVAGRARQMAPEAMATGVDMYQRAANTVKGVGRSIGNAYDDVRYNFSPSQTTKPKARRRSGGRGSSAPRGIDIM